MTALTVVTAPMTPPLERESAMNTNADPDRETPQRSDAREAKTFTLRMPLELHELVENAARQVRQSLNQFITDAAAAAARVHLGEAPQAGTIAAPVAILVDLDAFAGKSAVDIDAIERLATTIGRPTIKSSYSTALLDDLTKSRQALLDRYFRHEELPSRDALRIRVAADAIDMVTGDETKSVILVTADEEFGFLASLLARRGGRVIGVGVKTPATTSRSFIRTFDVFRFYDHLASPPASDELRRLRSQFAEHLVQVAHRLHSRGAKPVGAALIPLLRDRHPEVSLELLELRSWRELAEIARELGLARTVESSGVDFHVYLTEAGSAKAQDLTDIAEAEVAHKDQVESVRTAINDIIKTELPSEGARYAIFRLAKYLLEGESARGGISLIELSHRTAESVVVGAGQNTVYRLLVGLYRAGTFEFIANSVNEYDPKVLRARIPLSQFDDAFVLNLMRVRSKFPVHTDPALLSSVLYSSDVYKDKVSKMLRLASDSRLQQANLAEALAQIPSSASASQS